MSKRRLVKIVIEVLVSLTFIFSVTFTLLHAYGFRYDILERSFVKRTIVDLPGDLSKVYITFDGQYVADKAPYQIFGVKPGRHNVTVEKEGFHTWTENFVAKEDIVSSFPDVYLFPHNMDDYKKVISTEVEAQNIQLKSGELLVLAGDQIKQEMSLNDGSLTVVNADELTREAETEKTEKEAVFKLVRELLPQHNIKDIQLLYHPALNRKFVCLTFTNDAKGIYEITDKEVRLIDKVNLKLFDFTDNGGQLLYSDGYDVKVYDALKDEVTLLSRFSQPLDILQWYEDAYFIYSQAGTVRVCDQPLKHCTNLWQSSDESQKIRQLEYLPDDDLWLVVRDKEVSTYTFE